MDLSCKILLIGGLSSNLYVYNLDDNEFEEQPDQGDVTTGILEMALDTQES